MTIILKAEHAVENQPDTAVRSLALSRIRVTVRVPYRSMIVLIKWIIAMTRPQYIEYTVSANTQNIVWSKITTTTTTKTREG